MTNDRRNSSALTGARVRRSYDAVAERYVADITPVDRKPFECAQIDAFLDGLADGIVLDLGCGPGDVTRYLRRDRAGVIGIDLSPGMIEQARWADPEGTYAVGDLANLSPAQPVAGITSFYSLIHLDPMRVVPALNGWRDALIPGGRLLLVVHAGNAAVHLDNFLDHAVDLDFHFFEPETLRAQLVAAGFAVDRIELRAPYPDIEAPTVRLYVHATRPL